MVKSLKQAFVISGKKKMPLNIVNHADVKTQIFLNILYDETLRVSSNFICQTFILIYKECSLKIFKKGNI